MFFSIVEHIQDLGKQTQTRDTTVAAAIDDYDKMIQSLLTLSPDQGTHANRAQSLLEALQEQADAANEAAQQPQGQPQTGQPDPAQQAEALSNAALELGLAQGFMDDALQTMVKVQSEEGGMSHDLGPATDEQRLAIALKRALEALQPPQDQNDDDNQDEQNQDDQVEKQEAERRLQEAKEREQQRQKEKVRSK